MPALAVALKTEVARPGHASRRTGNPRAEGQRATAKTTVYRQGTTGIYTAFVTEGPAIFEGLGCRGGVFQRGVGIQIPQAVHLRFGLDRTCRIFPAKLTQVPR